MTDWTNRPTAGSRLMARAMSDNPGWKIGALAHASGLKEKTASRWLKAEVTPSDERVAMASRMLGYDARDFGVTDPRALTHAEELHPISPAPRPAAPSDASPSVDLSPVLAAISETRKDLLAQTDDLPWLRVQVEALADDVRAIREWVDQQQRDREETRA